MVERVSRLEWALSQDMVDRWSTQRRCTGKFKAGKDKGTKGKCATDEGRMSCLQELTAPGTRGPYALIGGNCLNHAEGMLVACCLRKNHKIHTGKPFEGPDWLEAQ